MTRLCRWLHAWWMVAWWAAEDWAIEQDKRLNGNADKR